MVFGHALDLPRSNGAKTWTKLLKILSRQSLSGNSDMSKTHKKHIPTGHFLSMSSEFGNLHEKKLSPWSLFDWKFLFQQTLSETSIVFKTCIKHISVRHILDHAFRIQKPLWSRTFIETILHNMGYLDEGTC